MKAAVDNGLMPGFRSKAWGWWYLCIGLGFLLLAAVRWLHGERIGVVSLRIGVAAGFALLAWMQLRLRR